MSDIPSNTNPDSNNEPSERTAIRQSFRVPVELQDAMVVRLDNASYPVVDIGPEGISIANKTQTQFMVGQLIEPCELIISGNRIKNLSARIVHCSIDSSENWNNGIQWISLTDAAQQQIVTSITKIKQRLRDAATE